MPVSIANSGSQTATLNTDHTLATATAPTGGALYQLRVDTNALATNETLTLTLSTRARVADTTRVLYRAVFTGAGEEAIKDSPCVAVPAGSEVVATLRQEGGTGRAFPWAVYRLDG